MIPLRDNIRPERFPIVNYVLIGVTALAFCAQLAEPEGSQESLVEQFGMIPARVMDPSAEIEVTALEPRWTIFGPQLVPIQRRAAESPIPPWLTLLTCIFLHGGWMHFLGNMWFLHVFGDNVEDRLGRPGYLAFYLFMGTTASGAHLLSGPGSTVPTIGASGAIAGVMGAYMLLYPHSRVQMLFFWGFFVDVVVLPAPFFLGYWFVLQLVQGAVDVGHGGGVAWWAHIGGFAIGAGVAGVLKLTERLRPEPASIVLQRRRLGRSPWRGGLPGER